VGDNAAYTADGFTSRRRRPTRTAHAAAFVKQILLDATSTPPGKGTAPKKLEKFQTGVYSCDVLRRILSTLQIPLMSSLTDRSELVGFFSYSREDDGTQKKLSALRERIEEETSALLGRTHKTFRMWQDVEAIEHGAQWQEKIKSAIAESVFFIPIITPRAVRSEQCKSELFWFLDREKEARSISPPVK
jgi:hypothetical protein